MAYAPIGWKDRRVQYPRRYTETYDADGKRTDTPSPGEVREVGTSQSSTNFNRMESGIQQANSLADALFSLIMAKIGHSEMSLEEVEALLDEVQSGKLDAATWTDDNRINQVLRDAEESVRQAEYRDIQERLILAEAQLAALTA